MNTHLLFPIVNAFLPHTAVLGIEPLSSGLINETYRVETTSHEATFLLQRINTHVFPGAEALMENHHRIATYLAEQSDFSLFIPTPIATAQGELCHRDSENGYWRLMPFLENTYTPSHLPNENEAYEAAHAYGVFLKALSGFPEETLYQPIPGFHDTALRYKRFKEVLQLDKANRNHLVVSEINQIMDARIYFEAIQKQMHGGGLTIQAVHNDTKAGNVLLYTETGKAAAVIDWDTIMPGSLLSDYGDMVRTFVSDRYEDEPATDLSLRLEVWTALNEGFLSATSGLLTQVDAQFLSFGALWIVSEQALRFLTDYLEGDIYYKTDYPDHNLKRAQNQLALLKAIEKNLDTMRRNIQ